MAKAFWKDHPKESLFSSAPQCVRLQHTGESPQCLEEFPLLWGPLLKGILWVPSFIFFLQKKSEMRPLDLHL